MPTTDRDAQALAYLASRLRDETPGARKWDDAGTYTVIKAELVGKNLAIAVEAVLCHATDTEAKTPGSLRRPFNPPRPSDKPKDRAHPPRKADECPEHPGQYAENCGGCAADRRAVVYDDEPPATKGGRRATPEQTAAALKACREAIHAAKEAPDVAS